MPETLDQLKARRASVLAAAAAQVAGINATAAAEVAKVDAMIAALGVERVTGTPIGTTGSFNNGGTTIAKVFDGSLDTYFDSQPGDKDTAWVGLDLGEPRLLTAIAYAPRAKHAYRMNGGRIEVSNSADFSVSTTIHLITASPADGVLTTIPVSVAASFRYVRYVAPRGSYGNIAELQVYAVPKVVEAKPPAHRCLFSLIMDASVDSLIDELGAAGVRGWGNFGTNGTITANAMSRANAYAKAGQDSAIVLSPSTNLAPGTAIDFTAVVDQFIAQADKRIRPNLVNEGNQLVYWPNGGNDVGARWLNSMRATQPAGKRLSAAGFATGSVSVTGYDEKWEEWFAAAEAEGLLDCFDRLVFHIYGPDLVTIRRRVAIARKIADRYGKKLDFDECGFAKTTTLDQVMAWFPEFVDAISVADYASWFIATKTNDPAKPDHDKWAWFVDPKTGEKRAAWIALARTQIARTQIARLNGAATR